MSRKNKHRTMQAPDMFIPEARQTFDVKTGERISYLDDLQYQFESEQLEPVPPLNEMFTQQLTLF